MSDTQKIVETLDCACARLGSALRSLDDLQVSEREALRTAIELIVAAQNQIGRRIAAHSNALEVQS